VIPKAPSSAALPESRAQLVLEASSVVLKVAIRSENADVSRMVADCVR